MVMSFLAVFVALCSLTAGQASGHSHDALRRASRAQGFITPLEFKHRLRVCNAYPNAAALDVYRGKNEKLTRNAMAYQTCQDFVEPLTSGDKLEFKVGDVSSGTFAVSDLPNNDAVLLLVVHRHDARNTAVSFESHVFANLENAQVAVIDTYTGKAKSVPRIVDANPAAKKSRSEELRYGSVVAINPGKYEVVLAGQDGESKAQNELVALNRESYVVLRTGVESPDGLSFPQQVVVFPKSDISALHSGAAGASVLYFVFALATTIAAW